MSIIFGIVKTSGQPIAEQELLKLSRATQKHAPDGTSTCVFGSIGMGTQPYRTHRRSELESGPVSDERGNMLSFDGRLDNHAELCASLGLCRAEIADSRIVLGAFARWGDGCFSHLIGDWALALWSYSERSLYLARDHAGSRSLYFEHSNGRLLWSTYLETFFTDGRTADLDADFAALYLACQPTGALTPYKGIKAIPPAHWLRLRDDSLATRAHWHWIVKTSIVYDKDEQYEEHFFDLFRQSVNRRSGSGAPIVAQLSGGMDSSSIVCMFDHLVRSQTSPMGSLETVSYYDRSEPNWDEFPFFTIVENQRHKTGFHIDASYSERTIRPQPRALPPQLWPGMDSSEYELDVRLHEALKGHGFRVILSGLGGDELLGGVSTARPELADLMARAEVRAFSIRNIEWCLANREPFLHSLVDTLRFACQLYFAGRPGPQKTPPWLNKEVRRQGVRGVAEGTIWERLRCPLPSRLANANAWWSILETLPTRVLSNGERFEYRYPYLDRNLVEFLFSIPTRQLAQPGRRRSLMRGALRNLVPREILERRRKAYLIRGPINLIRHERDWLAQRLRAMRCVEMGLVDPSSLRVALDSIAIERNPEWMPYFMRLMSFEFWLGTAPVRIPPFIQTNGQQDPSQVVSRGTSRSGNLIQIGERNEVFKTANHQH
jgi:asparagine synthase (glutamine-hydrolysing)